MYYLRFLLMFFRDAERKEDLIEISNVFHHALRNVINKVLHIFAYVFETCMYKKFIKTLHMKQYKTLRKTSYKTCCLCN